MTNDEHSRHLGDLLANFQSLEFILRGFLAALPTARPFGLPFGTNIYGFKVGTNLPENDFTSFDSLGELINKFNSEMRNRGCGELDKTLVDLRDALAHGRVSAPEQDNLLRLIKFGRPVDGQVRVLFNEVMSQTWFQTQKTRLVQAIMHVHSQLPDHAVE